MVSGFTSSHSELKMSRTTKMNDTSYCTIN